MLTFSKCSVTHILPPLANEILVSSPPAAIKRTIIITRGKNPLSEIEKDVVDSVYVELGRLFDRLARYYGKRPEHLRILENIEVGIGLALTQSKWETVDET